MKDPGSDTKKKLVISSSILAEGLWAFSLLISLIIAVPATLYFSHSVQIVTLFDFTFPIPFFGLLPIMIVVRMLHSYLDQKFIISDNHILSVAGRLSLGRREIRLDYENIRGIELTQNLYQRIVGIGTLKLDSSTRTQMEMIMEGIRRPRRVREIIEYRIHEYLKQNNLLQGKAQAE